MTRNLEASLGGRTPEQWARDFLSAANFPPTGENIRAVVSWEYAESGGGGGMYNPLNTTQGGYPGETDYNTVGVKNYAHYGDGIAANAKVIHNGFYPKVVDAFRRGTDARLVCDLITASPWGTGHIVLRGSSSPTPEPVREPMMLIASPHRPSLPGRTPAAVWNPAHPNQVQLTNGASIAGDHLAGKNVRVWSPKLPPGVHGVGIMATIGPSGIPNGRGIVLQTADGGTYDGRWS